MSVFMVLLIIGVSFPAVSLLLSFLLGSLAGLMNFLNFDFGDIDLHHDASSDASSDSNHHSGHFGWVSAILPLSPILWSVMLAVTGCVGEILARADNLNIAVIWVIALISGYTLMLIVNNCVMQPLKRAKNFAANADDIIGMQAEVKEAILPGGTGAVSVKGKTSSVIYAAKEVSGERIEQGETVTVLEIMDGRAIVQKNKLLQSGIESK